MQQFEPVVLAQQPDWVLVVGDVNSTLACALVCSKLGVPVAHVEAGLRSRDRTMPEEVNRVLTDQLSELLLTPSADADRNLLNEGIPPERIRLVGNVMIDSLLKQLKRADESRVREELGLAGSDYAVVTLHRPSNVDDPEVLRGILSALTHISQSLPVVFPIHPRTRKNLEEFGLLGSHAEEERVRFVEPLGYLDFLRLYSGARLVLTDSGGIQEETTALGVPCLTLRENTERPVTVELGTNRVVGTDPERIVAEAARALAKDMRSQAPRVPPLWDGRTAGRILDALLERTRELRAN
jgi:UDP-N-acetylglucosamine 2-epimerase (non-hydrolysing)